ncbi:phage baseplate assembly protein [Variovorax sp. PBL-E5]|uniref:phage baseplate assembly protein n=1 Tax=Variovorax sp. PBL-E5 TaxID=434014 RepID=UPI0013161359|nr:Mu P family protein [Variovorax sp. PBL-E5]VTU28439.1 Mu-like prophage tail protein gpP [Variovorax sp. PBL-E5]
MTDELTLSVGGRQLSGWSTVRVTRGIEHCPSDFEISLTERYPGEADAFVVQPGDACTVLLGPDLVLTGAIDRVHYALAPYQHTVTVIGRSKCADLVDCSAEWPGMQIAGSDALGIAQKLAQPYAITVSAPGSKGEIVQLFNLMHGETAFEIIERVCRYGALLAYDQPDGSLILSQAAQVVAASGFTEGVNVQSASMATSMDQRYSVYLCFQQSLEVMNDVGEGGNLQAMATDEGVPRHRSRDIISESPTGGRDFAQKRATWEANRRIGRSQQLNLVTDSWRDQAGVLWTPNTLVPLSLPTLKCGDEDNKLVWLVTQVTYRRDADGTTAALTIMRPEAFLPIPILQLPTFNDIPANPGIGDPWGNEVRR